MVAVPLGAVATALITQHGLDMMPCPWCVLQRMIFVAIAVAALPGLLAGGAAARWLSGPLAALLALSGMAAALWQHFVAAASTSCAMTLADRIVRGSGLDEMAPAVFAPYASCAEARATLLGLPYEYYSLALFGLLLAGAVALMRGRR
ncbi:MAG: disulfide bond formation protein B [Leptothrix sp. (in: Bacteria)]|nr:disulfide bond formation protein B [Leptothrix sp. (in: b-proteobacteria)]